ncbi:MAG TPA: SUMF1/EgtB/PvdO family nonheme iron enzyme [Terriglobia bacterium]|nr:SUMF1/EgtB/PvdO family nonheme iron enzyme [Terriglobia bacterium]
MERRHFLKSSAFGASALVVQLGRALPNTSEPEQGSTLRNRTGLPPAGLVEVPGASYEVTDAFTKVPVTLTLGDFLISATELTQREFEEVVGYNPAFHKGPDLPVETVNWWDAIRYCNQRSLREGLEPCYDLETGFCDVSKKGYRLPTDPEWTRAAGPVPNLEHRPPLANLGDSDTKAVGRLIEELRTSGTKPAGSVPPNSFGLYDMYGNVWEWLNDYFNPKQSPQRSYGPAGPLRGLARIIRGGSFLSTTSDWAGDYRSSMEPEYRSRFTGFRVCRTAEFKPVLPRSQRAANWFGPYNSPPSGYELSIDHLSPLVAGATSLAEWRNRRKGIRAKWLKLIGSMDIHPPSPETRTVEEIRDQNYTARLMYLLVEPDWWEKILIMMPAGKLSRPRPVVIVPFYDVDTPAGRDLGGRKFLGMGVDSFAYMAVQKGYIAVAVRWFGEGYGEGYTEAVANLKLKHPHCTGLGKWVWDARRLVDYLYTIPEVDREHIGIVGHSLGGKMALYAAAFDPRITVTVANELGIGLSFSNYDDYWYFGEFIHKINHGTDQHELLGLIAPRPFLLIGGDKFDTARSWYYINAARRVYELYHKPLNIGYFNHHHGHMPTPAADWHSMEWLVHFLGPQA